MMHLPHMLIFLGALFLLLGIEHLYIFLRLSHYLNLSGAARYRVGFIIGFLGVATLAALPVIRRFSDEWAESILFATFCWMGAALLLLVSLCAADLAWLFFKTLHANLPYSSERRIFVQRGLGFAALGATGMLSGFSLWNCLRSVDVKSLSITLKRLPRALDGLRIAQITDLHVGPRIDGNWVADVVAKVNALQPDIIAITGDLVDGSLGDIKDRIASIAQLKAPLGVYFITGNHEYYSGVEPWCATIAKLGLRVLRNERITIEGPQGESLDLAGVDDWASGRFPGEGPDLSKALAGRDPDRALILLAHQPAAVDDAAARGVDLQLSGHTHGGQIWPFGMLVYLQQPYVKGLHRHRDTSTQIYVSEGTGYWGPPMRFGTSAEITHITLRAG